jgi:hypothetical protein
MPCQTFDGPEVSQVGRACTVEVVWKPELARNVEDSANPCESGGLEPDGELTIGVLAQMHADWLAEAEDPAYVVWACERMRRPHEVLPTIAQDRSA